jgi:hypothetical protein
MIQAMHQLIVEKMEEVVKLVQYISISCDEPIQMITILGLRYTCVCNASMGDAYDFVVFFIVDKWIWI